MPIKNLDKYLDPPDEPEAEYCESCGKEMEILDEFGEGGKYTKCINPLCPDKFSGSAKALAERIVELEDENAYLKRRVKHVIRLLAIFDSSWKGIDR